MNIPATINKPPTGSKVDNGMTIPTKANSDNQNQKGNRNEKENSNETTKQLNQAEKKEEKRARNQSHDVAGTEHQKEPSGASDEGRIDVVVIVPDGPIEPISAKPVPAVSVLQGPDHVAPVETTSALELTTAEKRIVVTPQPPAPDSLKRNNIVIFGSSGVGKSSIVNLLVGTDTAPTGNNAKGCTFESKAYDADLGRTGFTLWDTTGLDESDIGTIPADRALSQLYDLIINKMKSNGLSLLIFCVRAGRVSKVVGDNWKLFVDIVTQSKVPVLLAITGLGDHQPAKGVPDGMTPEDVMKTWWGVKENKEAFAALGVKPNSVACITSIQGKLIKAPPGDDGKAVTFPQYGEEYKASRKVLEEMIIKTYLHTPWVPVPVAWLETVTETIQEAGCWPFIPPTEKEVKHRKPGKAFKQLQDLYKCSEAGTWRIVAKLTGRDGAK